MTGITKTKADREAEQERLGGGSRRVASITQYLKNLDAQVLLMQKTDENLIARLKQAEKDKAEVERRY